VEDVNQGALTPISGGNVELRGDYRCCSNCNGRAFGETLRTVQWHRRVRERQK